MTGLLSKLCSMIAAKIVSQLETLASRKRALSMKSAAFSLKALRFCASDSSLARKKSAFLSLMNSVISVVFPARRRPYKITRELPLRSYSSCRVSNSCSRSINLSNVITSQILYRKV